MLFPERSPDNERIRLKILRQLRSARAGPAQAAHPRRHRGLRGAVPQILPDVLRLHQGHDQRDRRCGGHRAEYLHESLAEPRKAGCGQIHPQLPFRAGQTRDIQLLPHQEPHVHDPKGGYRADRKQGGGETCLRGTRSRRSSIWRRLPSRSRPSSERCPRSGSRFSACRVSSTCRAGRSPNN